jgi:hypothetical protein
MTQEFEYRTEDSVFVAAGKIYKAGPVKKFFFGEHYRKTWSTPVYVPVINIEEKKGGLEILEQGGGMQTYSLKLKADNGKLYSLRSIQKDPSPVVPEPLRPTFFVDIVQDQISAAHPYGAFVLPYLLKRANLYHTNPQLYYLPDTEKLGTFQDKFGGMLMMLEEDADEDWSEYPNFGFTENAVSTETVREKLMEENESYVDQEFVARVRLFDMWIGDWDRHEGQWRWAELEDDRGNEFYRPIPEDRDNAFFKFDGFFPWIMRRKWAVRRFQKFDEGIRDIAGINFNARYFDRRFLTELERKDWLRQADSLEMLISNPDIDSALSVWPDDIYDHSGNEISRYLKIRKTKLDEFANRYYEILAENVNVYGSEENEIFTVNRIDDSRTKVNMYDLSDGEIDELLYSRTFLNNETNEIRLYGFEGEDKFRISGHTNNGIVVRVIGGEGKDHIVDSSRVRGIKRHTVVYDTKGTNLELSKESKDKTTSSLDVHRSDLQDFEYDLLSPLVSFGFNNDDGVFLGAGFLYRKEGFRKSPYKYRIKALTTASLRTGAWKFDFSSDFVDVIGKAGVSADLMIAAPNFTSNFYGLGNETTDEFGSDFYIYRIDEIELHPAFNYRLNNSKITFGPLYEYNRVNEHEGFLNEPVSGVDPVEFEEQHYVGFRFNSRVSTLDLEAYPQSGIFWNTSVRLYETVNTDAWGYTTINSEFEFFYTLEQSRTTFATRIGGAHNIGDYPFFRANTLGGNQGLGRMGNMRGMLRNRFSGESSFFQNIEIRQPVSYFETYVATFMFGFSGFVDYGRVWQPGENSTVWHRSYGGGVWAWLFYKWVINASYARSDVDQTIDVQLSFLF